MGDLNKPIGPENPLEPTTQDEFLRTMNAARADNFLEALIELFEQSINPFERNMKMMAVIKRYGYECYVSGEAEARMHLKSKLMDIQCFISPLHYAGLISETPDEIKRIMESVDGR